MPGVAHPTLLFGLEVIGGLLEGFQGWSDSMLQDCLRADLCWS